MLLSENGLQMLARSEAETWRSWKACWGFFKIFSPFPKLSPPHEQIDLWYVFTLQITGQ